MRLRRWESRTSKDAEWFPITETSKVLPGSRESIPKSRWYRQVTQRNREHTNHSRKMSRTCVRNFMWHFSEVSVIDEAVVKKIQVDDASVEICESKKSVKCANNLRMNFASMGKSRNFWLSEICSRELFQASGLRKRVEADDWLQMVKLSRGRRTILFL